VFKLLENIGKYDLTIFLEQVAVEKQKILNISFEALFVSLLPYYFPYMLILTLQNKMSYSESQLIAIAVKYQRPA
jgi:hypothetical protein